MINKIIRNFLAKQVAGRSDDGIMITLKDPKKVEMLENIMADLLMRNGIDPRAITSEAQLKTIINQIETMTKQSTTSGIRNTQSAKVFNIEGQKLDPNKPIIGGTQEGKELSKELADRLADTNTQRIKQRIADKKIDDDDFDLEKGLNDLDEFNVTKDAARAKQLIDDQPPPGSRGGKDDIAAPVQSSEESLKNMIEAENKKGIAKIKQRQKMLDDAIEDASPGFSGDRKYDAELVAENLAERMGLVYDDLPTKQRLDLYDKAYTGLSKKRPPVRRESLEDFVDDAGGVDESDPRGIDDFIPDPEDMAKGGIARIGLKDGMNRRTFLKLFTGLVSLPIIGKVLKPLKVGKTVTKVPIIKTDNVPGKPEWFDQLVNKVILEGDDMTKQFATKEREIVHAVSVDEDSFVKVTQDMDEGVVRVEYESPENMYGDPVQLRYKKPNPDEGDPRPGAEFETAESIPVARADGPDDYKIDIDEGGGQSISDLVSDVSKLKQYATGKKPTLKEIIQTKKRKDQTRAISEGDYEAETDFVTNRQGEPIIDMEPDIDDAFASGGIARMLGE